MKMQEEEVRSQVGAVMLAAWILDLLLKRRATALTYAWIGKDMSNGSVAKGTQEAVCGCFFDTRKCV